MYLETFKLPANEEGLLDLWCKEQGAHYIENPYPFALFPERRLTELRFDRITILYGGNGSGKSTLLNLIAEKLPIKRVAPFNSGEMFSYYLEECSYTLGYDDEGFPWRIPNGSRIITSDDIFDYMLTVRTGNDEIGDCREEAGEAWEDLRSGAMSRAPLEDYENFRRQVLARKMSRRQFIRRTAGMQARLQSNGETALEYFSKKLKNDTLYCLDEPENSMSPKMQLELVKMLEEMARYCGCQFIIATHSPFLLAMEGARIYDLDSRPAAVREWWQLENTRAYYEFFKKHSRLFE